LVPGNSRVEWWCISARPSQQRLEITEPVVQIQVAAGGQRDEHDARALLGRQRQQRQLLAVQVTEGLLAVDAAQAAREVVRPGVVGASEAVRAAGARAHDR
jgi:hypothetical protein